MEKFSQAFRERYGTNLPLDEIEEHLGWLAEARTPELDGYLLSPVSMLPSKIAELLHLGIYRVVELTDSAIREMNHRSVVSSCLLVRGTFETSCLLFEIMRRVQEVTSSKNVAQVAPLHDFITNTLLGHGPKAKAFFLFEEFVSTNVLTHIQKLSKTYDAPFEGYYEGLSEYCHPNSHGMVQLYTLRHHACVSHFTERNEGTEQAAFVLASNALATALGMAWQSLTALLETMAPLAVLAEQDVYDKGEWPSELPFPLTRPLSLT